MKIKNLGSPPFPLNDPRRFVEHAEDMVLFDFFQGVLRTSGRGQTGHAFIRAAAHWQHVRAQLQDAALRENDGAFYVASDTECF